MAGELLASKGLSDASYAAAEKCDGAWKSLVALVAATGCVFDHLHDRQHVRLIDPPAANPTPLAE